MLKKIFEDKQKEYVHNFSYFEQICIELKGFHLSELFIKIYVQEFIEVSRFFHQI